MLLTNIPLCIGTFAGTRTVLGMVECGGTGGAASQQQREQHRQAHPAAGVEVAAHRELTTPRIVCSYYLVVPALRDLSRAGLVLR